jgi:glycosyltransferase involved in cell wall biosynthesis
LAANFGAKPLPNTLLSITVNPYLNSMANKQIIISCIARFHHFHLARQMEKHGLRKAIYTGYPKFKLRDEQSIPPQKIKTFPYLQMTYLRRNYLGLHKWQWLSELWAWQAHETLDKHVARQIKTPDVLIALSGSGLHSGTKIKQLGGTYICDRGSSHIAFQNEILQQEHQIWGIPYQPINPKKIEKELNEYHTANYITVPSDFVKNSFIEKGVPPEKIIKIPYGARLDRFKPMAQPNNQVFQVLWVGAVSLRKGFLYALQAFIKLEHPNKQFVVIGSIDNTMKHLLKNFNLSQVKFLGNLPNNQLPLMYSQSHVFVLASIEEGLAMVQGEALACGCPVIATPNTGGADLFTHEVEGFIVPIRNADAMAQKLQLLADNPSLRQKMSEAALLKVQTLGGWDGYGTLFDHFISKLK